MATLAAAPFIKVEATKYTEVGYKGAGTYKKLVKKFSILHLPNILDVDSIIKGLVDIGIKKVKVFSSILSIYIS